MQKPHAEAGEICPFNGKDTSKVCHKCPMYIQIRGLNPNTGAEMDHWGCAFAWMPVLMIENSQQQRSTGAAVESFRNEMVKSQAAVGNLLIEAAQSRPAIRTERQKLISD